MLKQQMTGCDTVLEAQMPTKRSGSGGNRVCKPEKQPTTTVGMKSNGKSQIILVCLATLVACAALSATEGPLEDKAGQGDATAQFQLGLRYADGEGVPKNDTKAVE